MKIRHVKRESLAVAFDAQELTLLVKAMVFAADRHKDQRRKDEAASPYINHPLALLDVLVREGGVRDVSIMAAALLHDTIEDTSATASDIEREFGKVICGIVEEVTDDKRLGRQACKQQQIERAPSLSTEARAVKLADKICNLRDIAKQAPVGWELARCQGYFDWAKQVIDGLRGEHPVLEALFDEVYDRRPG